MSNDRDGRAKAIRIFAKSIYREAMAQGYDDRQIVALATELISEVTLRMAQGDQPVADAMPARAAHAR